MSGGPGVEKGILSGPPEIEAELVSEPSIEPRLDTAAAPIASAGKPVGKTNFKLLAAVALILALVGAGYWFSRFLQPKPAPELEATPDPSSEKTASEGVAANAPAATPTPVRTAETARQPDLGDGGRTDNGDALQTASSPVETATAAPPAVSTTLSEAPTPAEPDALAALEAAAERNAANESNGLVATPAPPPFTTPASPADGEILGEIQALRVLFETETNRLASELSAEKARAAAETEEMAKEIAALRAGLGPAPATNAGTAPQSPTDETAPAETDEIIPVITRGATIPVMATPSPQRARDNRTGERALLVLMALDRAIERGGPFRAELARAEAIAPAAPAIEQLRLAAAEGAPTLASLKARFPREARAALAADAGKSGGLFGRFSAGAAELVSVRPAGPVKGARPAAVLSRVEARLAADDLDGALEEMSALQGPARDALAAFSADAARLAATRASLDELNAYLIEAAPR